MAHDSMLAMFCDRYFADSACTSSSARFWTKQFHCFESSYGSSYSTCGPYSTQVMQFYNSNGQYNCQGSPQYVWSNSISTNCESTTIWPEQVKAGNIINTCGGYDLPIATPTEYSTKSPISFPTSRPSLAEAPPSSNPSALYVCDYYELSNTDYGRAASVNCTFTAVAGTTYYITSRGNEGYCNTAEINEVTGEPLSDQYVRLYDASVSIESYLMYGDDSTGSQCSFITYTAAPDQDGHFFRVSAACYYAKACRGRFAVYTSFPLLSNA